MTGLLQAPADRPAGKRGIRGAAAAVASVASILALSFGSHWDGPSWGGPAMSVAGAGLSVAAILLWIARRPAVLALGAALIMLSGGAWVVAEGDRREAQREEEKWAGAVFDYDENGPTISREEAEAVPEDATKDEVKAILGPAAGSGVQRVYDGQDLRCRVYRAADRPNHTLYALCFTGERYTDLLEW